MKDNNLWWISKMTQQLKKEKKNLASCETQEQLGIF